MYEPCIQMNNKYCRYLLCVVRCQPKCIQDRSWHLCCVFFVAGSITEVDGVLCNGRNQEILIGHITQTSKHHIICHDRDTGKEDLCLCVLAGYCSLKCKLEYLLYKQLDLLKLLVYIEHSVWPINIDIISQVYNSWINVWGRMHRRVWPLMDQRHGWMNADSSCALLQ